MICDICSNSNRFRILYQLDRGYKLIECASCKLLFLDPIPNKEDLYNLYKNDYFKAWGIETAVKNNPAAVIKLKELVYQSVFKEVQRFIKPGHFLDVGCAFGHSFNVAINRGWDPYGVEISPEACRINAEKFPSRIIQGDFSTVELANKYFDLVIMSDFIEHASSLTKVILKTHEILRAKGVIAIITPNIHSFSAKVMKKTWPHIKPEHTYYLSQKTLRLLFSKAGFRPILLKNLWKPINLFYLNSQMEIYGKRYQFNAFKSFYKLIPDFLKQYTINMPQGEILALAEKI